MRLKLVPENTNFDFFKRWRLWLGISAVMMLVAFGSFMVRGLNFGIDFRGGTTIRTESAQPVDVATYRGALDGLGLGDITIAGFRILDDPENLVSLGVARPAVDVDSRHRSCTGGLDERIGIVAFDDVLLLAGCRHHAHCQHQHSDDSDDDSALLHAYLLG